MLARRTSKWKSAVLLMAAGLMATSSGCVSPSITNLFHRDNDAHGYTPSDRPDVDTSPSKVNGELDRAQELFRKPDYEHAASAFERIYKNTKNSPAVAEEAMYYAAESDRLRNHLTAAEGLYKKQLNEFPSGAYKQQACQRLYDIAMFWLKDTEAEIQEAEKGDRNKWFTMPAEFRVHVSSDKPTLDMENRALQALEIIHYSDMTGPLADKAIFWAGYVKFFREDYREADHYFTTLLQFHKDSELAPRACELAILSKTFANGGPAYDGRPIAEARQLVDTAIRSYPELSKDDAAKKKMMGYLSTITAAQAEKDLTRAKFYERTEHPGSAYIVYELMRRRYPNTEYEKIAEEGMARLKPAMEKAQQPEQPNFFDKLHRRWNMIWGLDPNEDIKAGPTLGARPEALPASMGPRP
jgi:outer membrane protein assembly factor BamD (BamD/ComL family)